MDNSPAARTEARFVPDRRYTALAAGGLLVALGFVLVAGDPAGRLLAAVAAGVLVAYLVADLVFSPRLLVTAAGIAVNSPLLRTRLPWAQIEDVRADVRQRMGLRSTTLEIDAGPTLAAFSRRAIGTDPEAAAALITALRPPAG